MKRSASAPRVIALHGRENLYNQGVYRALEARGVEIISGIFAGRWLLETLRPGDVADIHWPSFFYSSRGTPRRILTSFLRFAALLLLIRARGGRIVWTGHNLLPHDRCRLPYVDVWGRHLVIALAERIMVHGPEARRVLVERFPAAAAKTVDIPHGHWIGTYPNTIGRDEARLQLGVDASSFVYLFLGLCKPYKNVDGLVRAFAGTEGNTTKWGEFVTNVYLPFYRRKWKRSSAMTNEDRLRVHLMPVYSERTFGSFNRDEFQSLLDEKAARGLSYSVVAHLRWDLRQIFRMAVSEGHILRNPAELLFVPRDAKRPERTIMTREEVQICIAALDQRERLIAKFAILAGLRPGEIFGLMWAHVKDTHVEIRQRVYRGVIDSPKSAHSVRKAALSAGLVEEIKLWREVSLDTRDGAWVFPSETGRTPLSRDNIWRRRIGPQLAAVGLHWVDFHVMRRTHATLMNELHDDPKLVADQLGHTVDVNQNVYTRASVARRKVAVDALESALPVM